MKINRFEHMTNDEQSLSVAIMLVFVTIIVCTMVVIFSQPSNGYVPSSTTKELVATGYSKHTFAVQDKHGYQITMTVYSKDEKEAYTTLWKFMDRFSKEDVSMIERAICDSLKYEEDIYVVSFKY